MPSANESDKKADAQKSEGAKSPPVPQGRPLPRTFETRGA